MSSLDPSILIIGGAGLVGSRAARLLRQLHPGVPITIGGRDRARALALASELGNASAVVVDLNRADLGLGDQRFTAIAVFVKDDTLNSLRYAQAAGAGHLSISSGVFEIAPEVALYAQAPARAAVVLGGHWLVGLSVFATLELGKELQRIDEIAIGALLDEQDIGGPASHADYERLTTVASSALLRKDGVWRWVHGAAAQRTFTDSSGSERLGQLYTPFDVVGLAAATNAASIRFDIVVGETSSRRRGEPFSTELIVELSGETHSGERRRVRHELIHPEGQAPVTAFNVVLLLERLAGLGGGAPTPPGLYFPEQVVAPGVAFERLLRFGLQHRRVAA